MSRFTEHQFDKLRHGNPDLAAAPEPEFRAPPPASYRRYAGEDLDNTVGHVSRQLCHVSCYVRRVSAIELEKGPSEGYQGLLLVESAY